MYTDYVPDGRNNGKTMAFILRHILNTDNQLYLIEEKVPEYMKFPCDHAKDIRYKDNYYFREVCRIYQMLHESGIETSLDKYYGIRIDSMCKKLLGE